MFNEKCPRCAHPLEQTNAVLNLTHGKVHFRSWICRACGTRLETRQLGTEPEEVLLTSPPRAQVDAALQDRMEAERLGHEQFFAKSRGRIHHDPRT